MGYSKRTLRRFDLGEYNEFRSSAGNHNCVKVIYGEIHPRHRERTTRFYEEHEPALREDEARSELFYGALLKRIIVLHDGPRKR